MVNKAAGAATPKPKTKRPPKEKPLTEESVMRALIRHDGMVPKMARALKVGPQTIRKFILERPVFKAARDEAREHMADLAENALYEILNNKNHRDRAKAAIYVLTSIGRSRGYGIGIRHELGGIPENGTTGPVKVQFFVPEKEHDEDEDG